MLPILDPDDVLVWPLLLFVASDVFVDDEEELGLELSSFMIEKAEKELGSFVSPERSAVRILEYCGKSTFGKKLAEGPLVEELDPPDVVIVDGEVRRLERLSEYSLLSVCELALPLFKLLAVGAAEDDDDDVDDDDDDDVELLLLLLFTDCLI